MDKSVIKRFWEERARTGSTRWTDDAFLAFEQALLGPLITSRASVLDLGSGFGELSRSVLGAEGRLVAVDQEAAFASAFSNDERHCFVRSDLLDHTCTERFDVVLLFGVITHLDEDEERRVIELVAGCTLDSGVAVVKNQCSDAEEFQVERYSADLGTQYVGRYPSVAGQKARLQAHFGSVDVVTYPAELKVHANSTHHAFVCSQPRRRRA